MTTIRSVEVTCPNCGATSEHQGLGSTNEMGSPDRDRLALRFERFKAAA